MRGPALAATPLAPAGVPAARSRRARFDELVLDVVRRLDSQWHDELGLMEFAVEEVPLVPTGTEPSQGEMSRVTLASAVPASGASSARVVLFRQPIELRCEDRAELAGLVRTVLVEQVAHLLGRTPSEVDSAYDPDE